MRKNLNQDDPFKTVNEQLPFFPDVNQGVPQTFICVYVNSLNLGDDPDPEKQIPVYVMADVETGEHKYIIQSYAIKKAVEMARKEGLNLLDVVFRFEFLGKTTVNGKPFNQFNTAYCTYEAFENSINKVSKDKPKK